jgi:hypothetical protein
VPGGGEHPPAFASDFLFVCHFLLGLLLTAARLAILVPARFSFAADGIEELLRETHWGESSSKLLDQFGDEARQLPRALDSGERIQLERPRHGVNPPSFRAIAAALHADYGKPDQTCVIPVLPASGYQAAVEERWAHNGAVISAVFRDTTLQAFEGCLFGPVTGWCGLHGQLLVRIGLPHGGVEPCALAPHHGSRPDATSTVERP